MLLPTPPQLMEVSSAGEGVYDDTGEDYLQLVSGRLDVGPEVEVSLAADRKVPGQGTLLLQEQVVPSFDL